MKTVVIGGPVQPSPPTDPVAGTGDREQFRLPITNTATLTVSYKEHGIPRPTSAVVTNAWGDVILVNIRIDPQTSAVTFHANKPITGYLLID